ncbi:MAG: ATP-binding protein [Bacteroidales bacterium]|nr:ATP-binding protein [Bacteroidales bacterium]
MKRKIYRYLQEWRKSPDRKPLVVGGARQVGKTYSIRQFGRSYRSFVEINFITQPAFKQIFNEGYDTDSVVKQITFLRPDVKFVPGNTLIFFDELQEYPDCATSLKFFKEDGQYDVICSGSMMGLNYSDITSNSVGYKSDVMMYSLDFEEFLWARGFGDDVVESMLAHMNSLQPFSDLEMQRFDSLFLDYVATGGMPEVVAHFVKNGNFGNVLAMQKQLLEDYEEDIVKYATGLDKAKIRNVYRNIPVFLAKENKKFQITKVSPHARSREYVGCVDWLQDAGIVNVCHCLHQPELPLKGNYDETKYKLYYHDNGLLMAALDDESSTDLRENRNLGVYKGAVYENIVSEALAKQGYGLYYYNREDGRLEMDFFVRDNESLIPVEVKATDGATVSLNNLIKSENYPDIKYGIKLCRKNIGFNGIFYTFPYFCAFLIGRWLKRKR